MGTVHKLLSYITARINGL